MDFFDISADATQRNLRIIIASVFALFFLSALIFRRRDIKHIIDVYELTFIAMGGTMGVLALWASFDDAARNILPTEAILLVAGIASLAYAVGKIFGFLPIRNEDASKPEVELTGKGKQDELNIEPTLSRP